MLIETKVVIDESCKQSIIIVDKKFFSKNIIIEDKDVINILVENKQLNNQVISSDTKLNIVVSEKQVFNQIIVKKQPSKIITTERSCVSVKEKDRIITSIIIDDKIVIGNVSIGTQGPAGPVGEQGLIGPQGDPGDFVLSDLNEYINISSQIDEGSGKKIFIVGKSYDNLRIEYNGRNQNNALVATNPILGTFELDFIPADGKLLAVFIDNP